MPENKFEVGSGDKNKSIKELPRDLNTGEVITKKEAEEKREKVKNPDSTREQK